MNGASERRTTTRAAANLHLAARIKNNDEKYLGFSAQRNDRRSRARAVPLHCMAQNAPARACRSSPSGCLLFLASRLSSFICAVCVSLSAISQVRSCGEWRRWSTPPRGRRFESGHTRATDRPTDRPPARPTDRLTDRPTDAVALGFVWVSFRWCHLTSYVKHQSASSTF